MNIPVTKLWLQKDGDDHEHFASVQRDETFTRPFLPKKG